MNISKESKKTFDDYYQQLIGYKIVSYKLDDECEEDRKSVVRERV